MPERVGKILPLDPAPLILVVDADQARRSNSARMIRALGYQARSCPTGLAALGFLKKHPDQVQLLLADLGLPKMDGGELAERARDLDPRLSVVLMAGPADPQVEDLLAGYHDIPLLRKPVAFGDLAQALESLLGPSPRGPGSPGSMALVRWRTHRPAEHRHF